MKPLEGVKVLEFSTMITASFAAMMMAEQGASVIKVEPIEIGDPMRFLGSSKGGISALFANCNRGKRSLSLDLKASDRCASTSKKRRAAGSSRSSPETRTWCCATTDRA
jgi:crotonobetainyl-CoA:carnitine CoA-transferase CaiB-like acyl-CoA transferase